MPPFWCTTYTTRFRALISFVGSGQPQGWLGTANQIFQLPRTMSNLTDWVGLDLQGPSPMQPYNPDGPRNGRTVPFGGHLSPVFSLFFFLFFFLLLLCDEPITKAHVVGQPPKSDMFFRPPRGNAWAVHGGNSATLQARLPADGGAERRISTPKMWEWYPSLLSP